MWYTSRKRYLFFTALLLSALAIITLSNRVVIRCGGSVGSFFLIRIITRNDGFFAVKSNVGRQPRGGKTGGDQRTVFESMSHTLKLMWGGKRIEAEKS